MSALKMKHVLAMCKTFYSLEYEIVARTYFRNSDKFLSIKDISMLSGVKPSVVRHAKNAMSAKGACFLYVGSCNDRKSKLCEIVKGKGRGYNINAESTLIHKALRVKSPLKMNNSGDRNVEYNKQIVNNDLNSVFN